MKLKLFLLALVAVLVPGIAYAAADVHATGVDLRPLLQEVLLTIGSIATLVIVWSLRKVGDYVKSKTGVNILAQENMIRGYLDAALQRSLLFAASQIDKAEWAKVETKNEMLGIAANYVMDAVPDALKYFKLDRESVLARLEARWPELVVSMTPVATEAAVQDLASRVTSAEIDLATKASQSSVSSVESSINSVQSTVNSLSAAPVAAKKKSAK